MGLDYIDMMLIHSPQLRVDFREEERFLEGNREAWKALEEAYKEGLLRAIGVSDFEKEEATAALSLKKPPERKPGLKADASPQEPTPMTFRLGRLS